ncbi:WD40 repeat-like protein [Thelephora ganbajun]|uniref:WD40 repeat-like protein n=1 Tax=Thelephora ganbajun TaxID=370292 RepID=A0ACB6Z1V0_THEGA|nr:WD40 repeat-like protein [Thelephora ganbajun]
MDKLIVRPLKQSGISTVIAIDALDECKDEEPASAILSVLGRFVSQIPKVKFFVTGRPEPWIREGFRLPLLAEATDVFVLHNVEPNLVNDDIRLFFKRSFLEPARRQRELDDWPTTEQLDLLCERAAGLFVYAAATIGFVGRRNNDPKEQLDRLLRSPESSAHEGKTKLKANTTLDSLYMSILQEAFGDNDLEDDHKTRSIFGAVILAANPLSPSAIATLLGFGAKEVFLRLSSIHSLLILQDDISQPVRSFHKSFPDFIVDKTRCTNERFHISPPSHHPELLAGCLKLMNQMFEKNMCNLPDAIINREVDDLYERTERHLDPALRYACKSWHKHLTDGRTILTPTIASALCRFLEKKLLFWLEVLSVLGAAREAVNALEVTAKWLEASPTLDLVIDCFRFVMGFFGIISTSCPHIYHSALPLCPRESIVRSLYEPHTRPLTRVAHGLPNSWESSIATMKFPSWINAAVWSPCRRFIAISRDTRSAVAEILDAVTLERITTLDYSLDELRGTRRLAFSQNARLLTWYGGDPRKFISWDLQTGGLVSAITIEQPAHTVDHLSVTHSACGTMVAVLFHGDPTFTISIYNVPFGTRIYSHSAEGRPLNEIWTHGESHRLTTMDSGFITTWEVGFASPHTPTRVESLPIPDNFNPSRVYQFHPTLSRLAYVAEGSIIVWDAQDSKFLLKSTDVNCDMVTSTSFSSDGRFFAYGIRGLGIHLWKESPTGYTLRRELIFNTGVFNKVLVSPNGESIIAFCGSVIQLWRTTDSITSPSDIPTLTVQRNRRPFILGLSPVEALAAVAQTKDETVTVLDLNSGVPRLTIDTGMRVSAVGMAGSVVVVVGHGKIVTWNLPTGSEVLNPRANINDNVLTTTLNCLPSPADELRPTSVSPDLRRIAMIEWYKDGDDNDDYHNSLHLYDVVTGQLLASDRVGVEVDVFFSPDGREVWSVSDRNDISGWKIIEDSGSGIIRLECLEPGIGLPGGFPWQSSHGYEVTNGEWVLSPNGKRLLWLPHSWRPYEWERVKIGRFLALLGWTLPEPVILELEE